jgi:hypothetical protein
MLGAAAVSTRPKEPHRMLKKHRQARGLTVARTEDVPLREVSGICLRRPHAWQTTPLTGLAGTHLPADDPQIEAICADGAGRVLLLQESPARVLAIAPPAPAGLRGERRIP